MVDPYLQRMHSDMNTWLILERLLCQCRDKDICSCGWDDLEENDG